MPTNVSDSALPRGWRGFLERNYGLDLRSLALFRVCLAVLLLGDLYLRALDLRAFYTDFGVLPRDVAIGRFFDQWLVSLHMMSGRWQVQALLFAVALVFALMLLAGWRTRLATIASWALLLSLQNRNPAILQGGDTLLRMVLFWAVFLPLGARYSVDSALDSEPERQKPERVFNAATIALMVQIALVYWFAALMKSGPEWREGTAVYYALALEQLSTPLGRWALAFPAMLKFLTFFTLAVEALAPFFLFVPILGGAVRTNAVLFLIALQLGFRAGLDTGHFPFVASVMMLAVLPTSFWQMLRRDSPRATRRRELTMYFDGECGFCRKSARIIREIMIPGVPLVEAQSDPAIHEQMRAQRSWVLTNGQGHSYFKTTAFAELLSASPNTLFWPLAAVVRWKPVLHLGDRIYGWVERNRSRLSRWMEPVRYRPVRLNISAFTNVIVVFLLAYVIWWNVGMKWPEKMMPMWMRPLPVALRIDQVWDMFSPSPLRDDGWYVIDATLRSGRHVDIFRDGAPVSWQRPSPRDVARQYPNERWRKYLLNLYTVGHQPYRLYYARYLCRKWNEDRSPSDPELLDSFEIYFMARTNSGIGKEEPIKQWMLHRHYCFR